MGCKCEGRRNDRMRHWYVVRRNWSASAFNGYAGQWSDYSDVECARCQRMWRTKARYVDELPSEKEFTKGRCK